MLKTWNRFLMAALLALAVPTLISAQAVSVSVNVPPPELPVYDQPPIPADGYLWTPGYWAWSDDIQDYYWVPGTWVLAPQPDYLWTPGYWAVDGGAFLWNAGYWGPQVGFYGGVNYGYGYAGNGYEGGYWRGGHLFYNRSVNNINNVRITNVYNRTVVNNVTVNRVSYNGGNGIHAQPTSAQLAIAHGTHIAATPLQRQHETAARGNPALRFAANKGRPPIAATTRPAAFTGAGVVGARSSAAVHATVPGRDNGQQRPAAHAVAPRPAAQEAAARAPQREPTQTRENAPERAPPPEERPREVQPPAELRRAPEPVQPARPAAPPPHPAAPHPAEHPPEHSGTP